MKDKKREQKIGITAEKLLKMKIDEQQMLIKNLLPTGLTIFGGQAKTGKTYLGLQLSIALTNNINFLEHQIIETKEKTLVLYFSNETSENEIKTRLKKYKKLNSDINLKNIIINDEYNLKLTDIDEKIEILRSLKGNKNARLVVFIDTFIGVKDNLLNTKCDLNNYEVTTKIMQDYLNICKKRNCSIILLHHLNKDVTGDILRDLNGSGGIGAKAENLVGLYKQNNETFKISSISRYLESSEIYAKKNEGFFISVDEDMKLSPTNSKLTVLLNYIQKQKSEDQEGNIICKIEGSASEILANANIDIASNQFNHLLAENKEFLKQCGYEYTYKRTKNGSFYTIFEVEKV